MANYFRITAYHPAEDVCAVFTATGALKSSGNSALISFKKASK